MEDRTDQQWLEALRENGSAAQTRAYTDLYHLLYRRLCGYIRQRSRTLSAMDGLHSDEIEALAEDYAQEALLRVWERLDDYKGTGKFTSWAFVIAVNIAGEAFRRKRWSCEQPSSDLESEAHQQDASTGESAIEPEQHALLQALLDELSNIIEHTLTLRERTVFVLHYLCDWRAEEIARHLTTMRDAERDSASHAAQVTENAVFRSLYRARRKIALALIEAGYDLEDIVDLPAIAWEPLDSLDVEWPDVSNLSTFELSRRADWVTTAHPYR